MVSGLVQANTFRYGDLVTTTFTKVRFWPDTLEVIPQDYTFAQSETRPYDASKDGTPAQYKSLAASVKRVPYGSARKGPTTLVRIAAGQFPQSLTTRNCF